jgi:hypothetical protein
VPAPELGNAIMVSRYGTERVKAVILHPDDFMSIEAIIDAYLSRPPYETGMSDLAVRAREVTEAHEDRSEYDYSGLAAALGE